MGDTMPKGVSGTGVVLVGIGAVFVYGGIRGYSMLTVIQNLVLGKPVTTGVTSMLLTNTNADTGIGYAPGQTTSGIGYPTSGNKALGQSMAAQRGWIGAEWTALDNLWTRESGWNNLAENPSSGAYGIPQALPPTKLPAAGQKSGGSDPGSQITWGLNYIAGRYGKPSVAWNHEQLAGWY